jgi:hypothetical protein
VCCVLLLCVVLLYDVFSIGIVSTRVDVILCLFFQRNIWIVSQKTCSILLVKYLVNYKCCFARITLAPSY